MKTNLLIVGISATMLLAISTQAQTIIANDDANLANYAPQPNGAWASINGGIGYDLWTPLSDASGGGTYMEGVGVNGRQVDGSYSFALYSGSGSYDISRALASSMTTGDFSILTRFDVAGAGDNDVDLRTGNDTSSFSAGDLLTFGLAPSGNELYYSDGSGTHTMASGEARGAVWDWNVIFDAGAGTYTLSVTNLGGGYADTVTGSLDASGTSVGSFAVINQSTGSNQNVIFDDPTFETVPEPTLAFLGVTSLGAMLMLRRRK